MPAESPAAPVWASGVWGAIWEEGVWASSGGGSESLAAGDLTTALSKWQAANGYYNNEQIRAALNTHYGTSDTDIMPNLARFLRDRQ